MNHPSLRDAFRYAKLIGTNEDQESLTRYSDNIFVRWIEEQLIYYSNSRQVIDPWIHSTAELFDEVIINQNIPITEMPSVQLTTILQSVDEECKTLVKKMKENVISSALKELTEAHDRCNIPPKDAFLNATKEDPLE